MWITSWVKWVTYLTWKIDDKVILFSKSRLSYQENLAELGGWPILPSDPCLPSDPLYPIAPYAFPLNSSLIPLILHCYTFVFSRSSDRRAKKSSMKWYSLLVTRYESVDRRRIPFVNLFVNSFFYSNFIKKMLDGYLSNDKLQSAPAAERNKTPILEVHGHFCRC